MCIEIMLLNIYRLFKLCDYKLPPSAKCGQFCLAKYSILYKKFYSQNWLLIRKEKIRETEIKNKCCYHMFVVIYMHSPSVLPSVLPHLYLVKTHLHPI